MSDPAKPVSLDANSLGALNRLSEALENRDFAAAAEREISENYREGTDTAFGAAPTPAGGSQRQAPSLGGTAQAMLGTGAGGLAQAGENIFQTTNAAIQTINQLPGATRAAADAQKDHIAAINGMAVAYGDGGQMLDANLRSMNDLAHAFNIMSPLLLRSRQEFHALTMGGRSFIDMGISGAAAMDTMAEVFDDQIMLQGLYADRQEYMAASLDVTHEANQRVFEQNARMMVFQRTLGLTNDQLQGMFDLQLTTGGQATDATLAQMSNMTLSLRTAGFNVQNLSDHITKLSDDFGTFGRLGPQAITEFAVMSQELGLDDPERLAGLVPKLDSLDELAGFQQELSAIFQTGVQLDINDIMQKMITDPAAGMELLTTQMEQQGLFEGLDEEHNIVRREMLADLMGMRSDELQRIADGAADLPAKMAENRAAIAEGQAKLEAQADQIIAEAQARGENITRDAALAQAAADEAAAESRMGVQTEATKAKASDVIQEGVAAQTAATGVQAAQSMSRTTVQALETTAHQAHQLGAALDEELRPTVEDVNAHLNNFGVTLEIMNRLTAASTQRDAAGDRVFEDPADVLRETLQNIPQTGPTEENPMLAATLVASARGLQAGMSAEGLTAEQQAEQQELFTLALEQARAAGATGATAENIAAMGDAFDAEAIFGDMADEVAQLEGGATGMMTKGLGGSFTGVMDDMGNADSVARQQDAMKEFWSNVLETESPTPVDSSLFDPVRNFMTGFRNTIDVEFKDTADNINAAQKSLLEGQAILSPTAEDPELAVMPGEQTGADRLADFQQMMGQTVEEEESPSMFGPTKAVEVVAPNPVDDAQRAAMTAALAEMQNYKTETSGMMEAAILAQTPPPAPVAAAGTAVNVNIDGVTLLRAIGQSQEAAGIFVEIIERQLGDSIASVGEIQAATGFGTG